MRLVQVKLSNFRCYNDQVVIDVDDLTVFVGKNDSGKSSIFDALDIFFTDKSVPDSDDVCVHGPSDSEIRIACVFDDLPKEIVIDEQHPTDLPGEYLVNTAGRFEIAHCYKSTGSGKAKLKGIFANANHPTTEHYNDLLTLTNPKLKQRATSLGIDLSDVNQTINTELRRAIWSHADDLSLREHEIELKGEAAGKIWDQLKKHLPVFALFKSDRSSTDQDDEAQDPMKAAIKEAIKAQEESLNAITEQVKADVQEIADRTVEKIREMSPELASQLSPRITTKNWDTLFSVSLTGDDDIPVNKRGSGTRRLILLNFFRAKAERDAETKSTGVIYAIEEPETSQHPHNQMMLIDAFHELADQPGCQILLTTHTPMLARRFDQRCLRLVSLENGGPVIHYGRDNDTVDQIKDSLGVLPDHNIRVFFGVEGRNDINFLRTISKILHNAGEDISDLGAAEDEGHLVFVPLGGSSLDLWVSRLSGLQRPEFYLMDRGTVPPQPPHYQQVADAMNARDHCTAWTTSKRELENYIHKDVIVSAYPNYAGIGMESEDLPLLFAQAVHEASESDTSWADIVSDNEKREKKESNAKKRLNTEFVAKMTPALLTEIDGEDELRGWLRAVGNALQP